MQRKFHTILLNFVEIGQRLTELYLKAIDEQVSISVGNLNKIHIWHATHIII